MRKLRLKRIILTNLVLVIIMAATSLYGYSVQNPYTFHSHSLSLPEIKIVAPPEEINPPNKNNHTDRWIFTVLISTVLTAIIVVLFYLLLWKKRLKQED